MHFNGVADQPSSHQGPSAQQKKQLIDLLTAAELQQYHSLLSGQLNVGTIKQLKMVTDDDLITVVGMSKPEVRRLRKFLKKMAGQSGTLEKIKNILSKSTHDTPDFCCLPVSDNSRSPTSFIIDQSDITISKELGRGSFGSVHSGAWITSSGSKLSIATRRCPVFPPQTNKVDHFLSTAQSIHLLKHSNLVRLFGVAMTTTHILMIMEQAPTGQSLRTWLQGPQSLFPVRLHCLAEFCKQVCSAMCYLEMRKFVHGDLSARNVLIFNKDLVKVTDAGLLRALDGDGRLLKTMVTKSHERTAWLAPECLEDPSSNSFSCSSDVWSFAVTTWEIFSPRSSPSWGSSQSSEILANMKSGKVLERPQLCPKEFYSLMTDCWQLEAARRPTFQQLSDRMNKLNPVRLQVEGNPVDVRDDQMTLRQGDVIAVIDSSSSGSPVVGWWKGLNESTGQVGFFNPVNMKLVTSDVFKQPVAKQQTSSSNILRKGQQRPKLTAGMISLPLNDLRHTSHVGRNGETFGCDMLPTHQVTIPLKDSTNHISDGTKSDASCVSGRSLSCRTTKAGKKESDEGTKKILHPQLSIKSQVNGIRKEASPAPNLSSTATDRELTLKLSTSSNLSAANSDVLSRVKYSPSSLSMVSADLSHVTSLVSSDTLTDVSSLPGDIGSLSKSDYEDYDCVDDDEAFDVTTDVDDGHPNDETIVDGIDNDLTRDDDDEEDDDSPQTIEESHTPKILDVSSSLFDEVMIALGGGGQAPNNGQVVQNGYRPKNKKKTSFNISDSLEIDPRPSNGRENEAHEGNTKYYRRHLASSEPCLDEKQTTKTARAASPKNEESVDRDVLRMLGGRQHQHQSYADVCDSSFTACSTTSLMSSSSDLKSSNSSLSSDLAHRSSKEVCRPSVLSKISSVLARPRSKEHRRRFSQASSISRLSVAVINSSNLTVDEDNGSKLSSNSFSGFDGRKSKGVPLDGLSQGDKYPSFLPNKQRSLKSNKAKDKLRRSSLILASMFQSKRDEKSRRTGAAPTSNFNTNELFFDRLREQEMEIAEEDCRRLREEEGGSEDSGVVVLSLNSTQEMTPVMKVRDKRDLPSGPKEAPIGRRQDASKTFRSPGEHFLLDPADIFSKLNLDDNHEISNLRASSGDDSLPVATATNGQKHPPNNKSAFRETSRDESKSPPKQPHPSLLKLQLQPEKTLHSNKTTEYRPCGEMELKLTNIRTWTAALDNNNFKTQRPENVFFPARDDELTPMGPRSSGSDSPDVVEV